MLQWDTRSCARFWTDLACVAISPFVALLIRDNFATSLFRVEAVAPYALLCILAGALVFLIARLHHSLWRYTSLTDILRIAAAATVVLLVALTASFHLNRLENVARSLPVIQWFLLVAAMAGTRIAVHLLSQRTKDKGSALDQPCVDLQHVLVVGINDLSELYLRSVGEFAQGAIAVVGLLSGSREMHGRALRSHKILGAPEDVRDVVSKLELHGVSIQRIIVAQPFRELSRDAQGALLALERSSAIEVDWLTERLGFGGAPRAQREVSEQSLGQLPIVEKRELLSRRWYPEAKRALDAIAAIFLGIILAPVFAIVSVIVAVDVGFPLVFWQQRPGRHGRPFKLFKFRTMRSAHDYNGQRIPEQLRSSRAGDLLRRTRLDELPQLYNILLGEMSFVGPRPLLPIDQPAFRASRLVVRPGLTGWAQVNGGRDISPEDKAALDVWYIANASLWLDGIIVMRTLLLVIIGERKNCEALLVAKAMVQQTEMEWPSKRLLAASADVTSVSS